MMLGAKQISLDSHGNAETNANKGTSQIRPIYTLKN
jgi:hypothetical protein